ncbi:hypothetical protein NYE24_10920 [Paenibacillus sp. FSL H7-0350]|uniref:hypothetical protein n=1 Tax=Paenibacillus sp. FSL H7-0350 TaxID=2975345 RepID=UPI0031582792
MWLQVVSAEGEVVYSINTAPYPALTASYSTAQLLDIQETRRLGAYDVQTQLNFSFPDPLLYVLGYPTPDLDQLTAWFNAYGQQGMVRSEAVPLLEQQLQETGRYLQVLDSESNTVQGIGDQTYVQKVYRPLDILAIQQSPDNYEAGMVVHRAQPLLSLLSESMTKLAYGYSTMGKGWTRRHCIIYSTATTAEPIPRNPHTAPGSA